MEDNNDKITSQPIKISVSEIKIPRLVYNKIPNKKVWVQDGYKLVKKEFKLNKKREIKNWKKYKYKQFKND